ncbi:hypothetical protein DFH27DRAFT_199834 [Peziza echinospora]|nr:hypothetical protein DFH27DRAFT_199834 [Peziza echinospora]
MLFHWIVIPQLLFLACAIITHASNTFPQGASNKAGSPLNRGIDGADTEPQNLSGASVVTLTEASNKPSHDIVSTIFTEIPNLDGLQSLSSSILNAQTPTILTIDIEPTSGALYSSVETLLYTHYYVVQTTTQTSVSEITQEIKFTDIEATGPKTLFFHQKPGPASEGHIHLMSKTTIILTSALVFFTLCILIAIFGILHRRRRKLRFSRNPCPVFTYIGKSDREVRRVASDDVEGASHGKDSTAIPIPEFKSELSSNSKPAWPKSELSGTTSRSISSETSSSCHTYIRHSDIAPARRGRGPTSEISAHKAIYLEGDVYIYLPVEAIESTTAENPQFEEYTTSYNAMATLAVFALNALLEFETNNRQDSTGSRRLRIEGNSPDSSFAPPPQSSTNRIQEIPEMSDDSGENRKVPNSVIHEICDPKGTLEMSKHREPDEHPLNSDVDKEDATSSVITQDLRAVLF